MVIPPPPLSHTKESDLTMNEKPARPAGLTDGQLLCVAVLARECAEKWLFQILESRTATPLQSGDASLDSETEKMLREYLWFNHGHQGIYGDDGEMQCGQCAPVWDYRRAPLANVVRQALKAREAVNLAVLVKAQEAQSGDASEMRQLISAWRAKAMALDGIHATMGTGWWQCAKELEDRLASVPRSEEPK